MDWEDPLEKEMAAHSSILAWKIPWTEEPGGLQSMGSQRVGCDRVTLSLFFFNKKGNVMCPWGHKRVGQFSVTKKTKGSYPTLLIN